MQTNMLGYLGRNWGWISLRGAVAVLFGVLAIAWPDITLTALVLVWGAYALADGILALIAAWQVRDLGRPLWALVVVGLLGVAAGVASFLWPQITGLALLMVIAVWALLMGVFQIIAAIRLRKAIEGEWLLLLSGVVSMVFGVLMIINPRAGAQAMLWVIGAYAIVFGVLLIVLGFRVRSYAPGKAAAA